MDKTFFKNFLFLNLGIIFISTTGVLGRSIQLSAEQIIFWRCVLAFLILLLLFKFDFTVLKKFFGKDRKVMLTGALLMGLHWFLYFLSLKMSNVAIAMLSIFTYPVITSILEPILLKVAFQSHHILIGFLTLLGIYLLVPDFNISGQYFFAVLLGVGSALAYAIRNIMMKSVIRNYKGMEIMFYQSLIVGILFTPTLIGFEFSELNGQWVPLILLSLFATVIGHSVLLSSLKNFSTTTASVLSCSQPIFGIILAAIFLAEYPNMLTILGGALILSSIILESLIQTKLNKTY